MTQPRESYTIPQVAERFRAYHEREPVWGSLHIVLEDGNVSDHDVQFCIEHAGRRGDWEGQELARILLAMTKTQRLKLGSFR